MNSVTTANLDPHYLRVVARYLLTVIGILTCAIGEADAAEYTSKITVRVRDASNNGISASVVLSGPKTSAVTTPASGDYTFLQLPAGTYRIIASTNRLGESLPAEAVLAPGNGPEVVVVRLPAVRLTPKKAESTLLQTLGFDYSIARTPSAADELSIEGRLPQGAWMRVALVMGNVLKKDGAAGFVATSPGTFEFRSVLKFGNRSYFSPICTSAVHFPEAMDVAAAPVVKAEMNRLWKETKDFADQHRSPPQRKELGCFIFLDTATQKYVIGPTKFGKEVGFGAGHDPQASVNPGPTPNDSVSGIGPAATGTYVVAFFHTHTPYTFAPSGGRTIGASQGDGTESVARNLPALVYDYIKRAYPNDRLLAGHPIGLPFKLYLAGPAKRQLINGQK